MKKKLYRTVGDLTPIPADCGELCASACCKGGRGDGMLLLPGEEALIRHAHGFTVGKSAEGRTYAVCEGTCRRKERPFACRIYPLVLWKKEDKLYVTIDPRAKYRCPLLKAREYIDRDFVRALRRAGKILMDDPEGSAFLDMLAEELEAYRRFTGM